LSGSEAAGSTVTRAALSIVVSLVAGASGLAIAIGVYVLAAIVAALAHMDIVVALYGSMLAAMLAGAAAARFLWAFGARRTSRSLYSPAVGLGVGALSTVVLGSLQMELSPNPMGFIHTWGALYAPLAAVQACAAGMALLVGRYRRATADACEVERP
jgi:hypothetical protein